MVADGSLAATGLVQPGSLIYYLYRLKLPPEDARRRLAESARRNDFPRRLAHPRTSRMPPPGTRSFVDRTGLYLTLVGLARCWSAGSASAMRCAAISRARPRPSPP